MKIDFHVLEASSGLQSLHYVCNVIEKAYAGKQPVYVHATSKEEAERLDNLLWTYRDDSFIPHALVDSSDVTPPLIQIGFDAAPAHQQQLLINLSRDIPAFYQQFARVIEIVFNDPVVQQLARDRFRRYREFGCDLSTHKIKTSEQHKQ